MKQFNLEEFLKNPNRKVVTRDGRPVRIVCTDRNGGGNQPVVALYPSSKKMLGEIVSTFCANGEFTMGIESEYDLFFAPEKKEGWANIYLCEGEYSLDDVIYSSRIDAEESGKKFEDYLTTIQIEWEE